MFSLEWNEVVVIDQDEYKLQYKLKMIHVSSSLVPISISIFLQDEASYKTKRGRLQYISHTIEGCFKNSKLKEDGWDR